MSDLVPSTLSAVAWTMISAAVGSLTGIIVDLSFQKFLPVLDDSGTATGGGASGLSGYLGALQTSSKKPQYALRWVLQTALGTFALGEMMGIVVGAGANAPIGDGTLTFWFYICQPFLIFTTYNLLHEIYKKVESMMHEKKKTAPMEPVVNDAPNIQDVPSAKNMAANLPVIESAPVSPNRTERLSLNIR